MTYDTFILILVLFCASFRQMFDFAGTSTESDGSDSDSGKASSEGVVTDLHDALQKVTRENLHDAKQSSSGIITQNLNIQKQI